MNRNSKIVFYVAAAFAFLALAFGLVILFGNRLPEGVLIIGLGFCIFGTAGLFTTLGKEADDAVTEVAKKVAKHKKPKASVVKAMNNAYDIFLNPVGVKPVACKLSFKDNMFVADTGEETLQIRYSDIRELRLNTPVLYIDWKDGTTWEMRFVRATAPARVYNDFQARLLAV